jgi:hypothetical protein
MYVPSYFTGQTAATISAGNGSYYPSVAALGDPQDFDATDLAASMDVVVDFLSNNSLDSSLIYVGEFGANYETDDRGGDTWTWDAVDYFESAGWFWTWWSYSVVQKSPQYDASGTLQTTTARLDVLTSYWQGTPVTRPTHTHP